MAQGESRWNLNKLKDTLLGGEDDERKVVAKEQEQETVHAALRAETKVKEERGDSGLNSWKSKLKDALDGDDSNKEEIHRLELELEKLNAEHNAESWSEKIKGQFDGSEKVEATRKLQLEEQLAAARKKESDRQLGWKDHIAGILDGEDEEGKAKVKEELKRNDSWREKLGSNFFATAPKPEQEKKPFSLGDKLNTLAGGGASSEANEDKLDKVIDLYQEHVLKQGQQSNESAFEQAKDEQISDLIRGGFKTATGRDFPLADKKH